MNHGVDDQSMAYLTLINTLSPIKFYDSSYGNDMCDSITNDQYAIQIFLPNTPNPFVKHDSEDSAHFSFAIMHTDGYNLYIYRDFTISELLWLLTRLNMRLSIGGKSECTLYDWIVQNADVDQQEINFREFVEPYLTMVELGDYRTSEHNGERLTIEYIQ